MPFSFSRSLNPAFVFAAGLATIAIFNIPVFNSALKNAVYWVADPLQKNLWVAGAGINNFVEPLKNIETLAAENESLRQQANELSAKTARVSDLEKENEFLRQALNLEMGKGFELSLANIVAKIPAKDVLIIDKGSNNSIEAGMPVVNEQKALVGKILKVYADFSEVVLVSNKDFSFDVNIADAAEGLVKGQSDYCAILDFVPKDKKLQTGQTIFTSRLGGIFPAGFLVGNIKEIRKNDVETFQSAEIALAFDAKSSSRVFVLLDKYPLEAETREAPAENKP